MKILAFVPCVLILTLATTAPATNYYVRPFSPTPTDGLSWTNWAEAHTNLIEVVARSRNGDTVYLTNNATYYLTNQLVFNYAVTLRGWAPDGGLDPHTTILNGNYPATTNRIANLNHYGAWLKGLTLTNGCFWSVSTVSPWSGGGAVYVRYGHLTNCIITGNRNLHNYDGSVNGGGGVFLGGYTASSGTLWNCRITGNTSTNNAGGGVKISYGGPWRFDNCEISCNDATNGGGAGGGVSAYMATALDFYNCRIVSNTARLGGGGIMVTGNGELNRCVIAGNMSRISSGAGASISIGVLRNCVIFDNTCLPGGSSLGAGAYFAGGSSGLVENCTIFSNTASISGGVGVPSGVTGRVDNCIIWDNAGAAGTSNYWTGTTGLLVFTNSCTTPAPAAHAVNCITAYPALDAQGRIAPDSPCVNAGVNREWMAGARDFWGIARIDRFSGAVDMGAYEVLRHGTLFQAR